jgi:prepilin-type N-terminal cleavage/methylation domain-containing protein
MENIVLPDKNSRQYVVDSRQEEENSPPVIYCPLFTDGGFTMLEIVVVLTIILIGAALVAIGPGFVSADRISSTSRELFGDLQWIRHAAMTQGPDAGAPQLRGFAVRFESEKRYRLFRFNDTNSNFIYDGPEEELPLGGETASKIKDIPPPLELKRNSGGTLVDPANRVLIFDHLGIPRAASLGFQQISIAIQNPNTPQVREKCITVSFNRIREGRWNGSECSE